MRLHRTALLSVPLSAFLPALLVAGAAHASVNLIQNGSFETGSFASWTTAFGDATTFVDGGTGTGRLYDQASDGRWLAFLGSTQADGGATLSQSFATSIGATYLVSFDLANSNGGAPAANGFSASIGRDVLLGLSELGDQDYVRYATTFTATGPTATLTLVGFNDASYLELDDVTVAPAVPEPTTAALCLGGLLVLAGARARRRPSR